MGVFAPAAGPLAARIGATRAMTLVLLTIGVAGIARAVAPGALGVIVLTVPIGIGIAIGNVLAPVIVKTAFADRPLLATGLFAFGIQIGAGAGGALAVPLADALGGWRDSLLVISLVCAVVAVAWIPVARAVHMPAADAARARPALALPGGLAARDHVRLRLDDVLRHRRLAGRRLRRARLERGARGLADRDPQRHGAGRNAADRIRRRPHRLAAHLPRRAASRSCSPASCSRSSHPPPASPPPC